MIFMTEQCEVNVTDHPKARVNHRCDECLGYIQKGEIYTKHHGVFDGAGFTHKVCSDCAALIQELNAGKMFDDTVYFGGLYEFSYETGLNEWKRFLEIKKKRGATISESTLITLKEWEEDENE